MMLYYMMENGHKLYDEMIKKHTEYTEADFQRDAAGARFGFFVATNEKKVLITKLFLEALSTLLPAR